MEEEMGGGDEGVVRKRKKEGRGLSLDKAMLQDVLSKKL